jgi:hypothetical protein
VARTFFRWSRGEKQAALNVGKFNEAELSVEIPSPRIFGIDDHTCRRELPACPERPVESVHEEQPAELLALESFADMLVAG